MRFTRLLCTLIICTSPLALVAESDDKSSGGPALTAEQQEELNEVLAAWEEATSEIKDVQCNFIRWHYDPVFGPRRDPGTGVLPAATIAEGRVAYRHPQDFSFVVDRSFDYVPKVQTKSNSEPSYRLARGHREKWIWSETHVYVFDFAQKKRHAQRIPRAVDHPPIPPIAPSILGWLVPSPPPDRLYQREFSFILPINAERIREFYRARLVAANEAEDEVWVELESKDGRRQQLFKKIAVYLDKQTMLPKGFRTYPWAYDERTNPTHTAYAIKEFQINTDPVFSADLPSGWTKIEDSRSPSHKAE